MKRKIKEEEIGHNMIYPISPTIDQCCSFVIQEISSVAKIKNFSCKKYGAIGRLIASGCNYAYF